MNLPGKCPVCSGDLVVTRLYCPSCETTLEGSFALGSSRLQEAFSPEQLRTLLPFSHLTQEQLYFVLTFVRCEGRFNRMEEELGLSYPTLRSRLDELIRALGFEPPREAPVGSCPLRSALRNGSKSWTSSAREQSMWMKRGAG